MSVHLVLTSDWLKATAIRLEAFILMGVLGGSPTVSGAEPEPPPHRALALPVVEHRPGFTRVDASQSGMVFSNVLTTAGILKNRILENGSGVTVGDVDGDGWSDLYLGRLEGPNVLYRNLGGWRFEDVTARAGLACPELFTTGVLFVDVDGDGDLDALVNAIGAGTRLFLNDGKGVFTPAPDSGLIPNGGSHSLALADLEGDGDLDLYVANYRSATFKDIEQSTKIRLRQVGNELVVPPEFAEQFIVTKTAGGHDLLEIGEADVLYRNDGRGRFTAVSWTDGTFRDEHGQPLKAAPRDWGLTVAFRDLNQDGAPDLYVCNDFFSPDRVWLNNGQGEFRALPAAALRKTTWATMSLDVADVDRDGWDDLLTVDMLSRHRNLRLVQRSNFQLNPIPWWGWPPDRDPPLNRPQTLRNVLHLNRGDGTYAEIGEYAGLPASEWTWNVAFLDVDLDGYEDLLAVNGHPHDMTDSDALNRMDEMTRQGGLRDAAAVLAVFPELQTANLAFRNLGGLRFEEVGALWGFDWVGVSQGMALGDLDNDGDLDVVLNNLNAPAGLYRNESGAPRLAVRLRGLGANTQGIGARVLLRGGPVPLQTQEIQSGGRYLGGDQPQRVFATGQTTQGLELEVRWRSGRRSLLPNVQPNHLYEVDEAHAQPFAPSPPPQPQPLFQDVTHLLGHRHHELLFDDFDRQPLLSRRLSQLGPGVGWLDANGDGWEDLLVGTGRGGALALLVNQGPAGFGRLNLPVLQHPAPDDLTGIIAWSAAPGHSTWLVGVANYETGTGGGVEQYDVFFGNVDKALPIPGELASVGPLAVTDAEGDGALDLFVGSRVVGGSYPLSGRSRLYRQREGRWELEQGATAALAQVGMVSGAVWSDLEGDGQAELVLACEWGPVRVIRQQGGQWAEWNLPVHWAQHPQIQRLSDLTGWWTGVSAGDFDGDGRLDLVVGNWGLNHRYAPWVRPADGPTAETPNPTSQVPMAGLRLWHGDVDGNGTWEVVETHPEGGRQVPWKDWRSMRAAVPILGERFSSYAAYAQADLQGIFGAGLEQLETLEARVLESVVLLNRGDRFEVRSLPREAQWAPVFGLSVADADGDGREDLFVAQNFFANEAELGRYDAGRGLWLRGDGQGSFRAWSGQDTGVKVYGEQRGCAVGDYDRDGRVDLVVTQNGGETRLYRNVGARVGLRVRLVGAGHNGVGLGAVLRVGTEGHWGPVREVHGGSGYWSQDSALVVLSLPEGGGTLQIRWPGGKVTQTKVPAGTREIEAKAP